MSRLVLFVFLASCLGGPCPPVAQADRAPKPQHTLQAHQTHNKFSRSIAPVLRVDSGAIVEIFTQEATAGQLNEDSQIEDLLAVKFDPIHPLTGPIFVEGAEPGDILAVTLHEIEIGSWGWTAILPGFGFLSEEFTRPFLKTYSIDHGAETLTFADGIEIPLRPFPGVLGVAPDTDELLSTIPPRANGGNMDDPHIVEGTTVYLPVFVPGALFSIGDAHAAQGLGEVCGTAIEAPMRFIVELEVVKNRPTIQEPQYETAEVYAVTGFATSIDEAARKATRYMIQHLTQHYDLTPDEAYALCSLAGDLKIAEVVDVPHVLVTMHIPKEIFVGR